ncbi:Ribosomal protein L6, putative [Leishmania shawi]|uniref:Ribosomal protein L6 n=1 Tax=Leishmania shawi TaxID=5680 RepID=A0ABR3E7L6_9TRYP
MVKIKSFSTLEIPEGVTVEVRGRKVTVTGKRGTLTKDLTHLQLDFRVDKKNRTFTAIRWFGSKIPIACLNTTKTHVQNMITGVTKGYRFKVRCAYVEVRNFLGEKRVRRQTVPSTVKVSQTDPSKVKDEIVFDGNDLEQVSREAAVLHQMCLVRKKDIRKFLDGIYVQTKTNVEAVE